MPNNMWNPNERIPQPAGRVTRKFGDDANIDVIDAVIGIAIFAATIGLIGSQITSAGANLTAFPGASTLLYLVPLILVAVLVLKLWKGRSAGRGRHG